MNKALHGALLAIALGLGAASVAPPAQAAGIGLSLDFGDVALGYQSGYYDHHHHWHRWHNRDEWRRYSAFHHRHRSAWGDRHHGSLRQADRHDDHRGYR